MSYFQMYFCQTQIGTNLLYLSHFTPRILSYLNNRLSKCTFSLSHFTSCILSYLSKLLSQILFCFLFFIFSLHLVFSIHPMFIYQPHLYGLYPVVPCSAWPDRTMITEALSDVGVAGGLRRKRGLRCKNSLRYMRGLRFNRSMR